MKIVSFIALAALLATGPAGAQNKAAAPTVASPMRPGLWETTLVIETAGTDRKRTVVGRACYSASDVADFQRVLPKQREFGMKCENRDLKAQGVNGSWHVACTSAESTLSGSAEVVLAASSYSGHAALESKKRGAKPEKVTQAFSGKWLEACK